VDDVRAVMDATGEVELADEKVTGSPCTREPVSSL
jgi:hypothetical protein